MFFRENYVLHNNHDNDILTTSTAGGHWVSK